MPCTLRTAYYGGWRAGMSEPRMEVVNGHKYIAQPQCPYDAPCQLLLRLLWQQGLYTGSVRRLSLWLAIRKGQYRHD